MVKNTTTTTAPKDGDEKAKKTPAKDTGVKSRTEPKPVEPAATDVHQVNTKTGAVDDLQPAGNTSGIPATPAEGMRNEVAAPGHVEGQNPTDGVEGNIPRAQSPGSHHSDPTGAFPGEEGAAKKAEASVLDPASDGAIERKIQALGLNAPRLTPDYIQSRIIGEDYTRLDGTNVTICTLSLRNGTVVTGINHGPVSASNFNQEIAAELAYKKAVDEIWPREGYLLAEFLAQGKDKSELNPVWEIARAVYAVSTTYAGVEVPAWADAGDEAQQAMVNRVADELAGRPVQAEFPDAKCSAIVSALVAVLGEKHRS